MTNITNMLIVANFIMLLVLWGCIIFLVITIRKSGIIEAVPGLIGQARDLMIKADQELDNI